MKDKRDAKVLEKEVLRKQRVANKQHDQGNTPLNPLMPPINEAENEDKDLSADTHTGEAGKTRNVKGLT